MELMKSYDSLTLTQKVDAFEHILDNTMGLDLARQLWTSARDSADWCERRRMFSHSLATNNVVDYILGLGDRHLANIMMQRSTGSMNLGALA